VGTDGKVAQNVMLEFLATIKLKANRIISTIDAPLSFLFVEEMGGSNNEITYLAPCYWLLLATPSYNQTKFSCL